MFSLVVLFSFSGAPSFQELLICILRRGLAFCQSQIAGKKQGLLYEPQICYCYQSYLGEFSLLYNG